MSYTYTQTESVTFTITHAKYLAAKVATDLKRIQRFYNSPTDDMISKYEEELIQLLKNGYLEKITYGFRRNGNWIRPTVSYTAQELGSLQGTDDDPGKILPGADISGAFFGSFLEGSRGYLNLSTEDRQRFNNTLPFQRGDGSVPGAEGYFSQDRSYFSGGRALNRSTLNSY